jgi:hypothetical protein
MALNTSFDDMKHGTSTYSIHTGLCYNHRNSDLKLDKQ